MLARQKERASLETAATGRAISTAMSNARSKDPYGIEGEFVDVKGQRHETPERTRAALLTAMGADPTAPAAPTNDDARYADVLVLRGARDWRPTLSGELTLEDGTTRAVAAEQPVQLPLGYHELRPATGKPIRVIACPRECYLPDDLKTWGWAAQLYAARSRQSWGIGDLADLRTLGAWSRRLGATVIMTNPLSAATPVAPIEPSPYYPSSRRFRNPIYLRVEDVPGAAELGEELTRLAVSARGLNALRRIERDAVFALKMQALEKCFTRGGGRRGALSTLPAFERYLTEHGAELERFATYCAIAELHGKDWRCWPAALRAPEEAAVAEFAARHDERVAFHAWLQCLLELQLSAAAETIGLIQDLPIGFDVAGADAWVWQGLLAAGVSVGAPPDEFNPAGQDWGLTPFVPHKLRGAGYQPFIDTVRSLARHAVGLRIDHVMGLFRLYWIPRGLGPDAGAFVRTRAEELLAILALESQRAKTFVVGEDLGTVEPGIREAMREHRMLSYRLMYFEAGEPCEYPELALASVTTHDLPTIAGLWTGADPLRCKNLGVAQDDAAGSALCRKLAEVAELPAPQPGADVARARECLPLLIERVHRALGQAPSRVLLATLDDALALEERPNVPGAGLDAPNWSLALPLPLEDIEELELPRRIADALTGR